MKTNECLVIGAGMSGLIAARALTEAGYNPLLVDKGRGLGGRLATRRLQGVRVDHGAQFFQVSHPRFRQQVDQWSWAGLVKSWGEKFPLESGYCPDGQGIGYCGIQGMTAIAKHLGEGLSIRKSCRIAGLRWKETCWEAFTETGEFIKASTVLLTAPVPQTLEILRKGETELPDEARQLLTQVRYAPCLATLVLLDGPSRIPRQGGVWLKQPLAWIADNTVKGIQEEGGDLAGRVGVTIHSGVPFAEEHWDDDPEEVAELMCRLAGPWLGENILEKQMHRWRYAQAIKTVISPCLELEVPGPMVLAGDAFGSGGVEGAALSGWAAAEALEKQIKASRLMP